MTTTNRSATGCACCALKLGGLPHPSAKAGRMAKRPVRLAPAALPSGTSCSWTCAWAPHGWHRSPAPGEVPAHPACPGVHLSPHSGNRRAGDGLPWLAGRRWLPCSRHGPLPDLPAREMQRPSRPAVPARSAITRRVETQRLCRSPPSRSAPAPLRGWAQLLGRRERGKGPELGRP